jgi:ATP/maltotriose-dependent transcriptional regulator MalT
VLLDDFHLVQDSEQIRALVGYLIESPTDKVHFIIGTRGSVRLPIARLKAYGAVRELGNEDLAFTSEEARSLLLLHDARVSDGELALICERTLGWGAGLVMLALSLKATQADRRTALLANIGGSLRVLYDFLADEVFARESTETQRFLLATSVLTALAPDVCDLVAESEEAGSQLEMLEMRGLFVIRTSSSPATFRLHPLFREFLHAKLIATESAEAIQALHRRAAVALAARGDWDSAIRHYCQSRDYAEAIRIVECVGPDHLEAGFFDTVLHWLELLPEDALRTRPGLLAQKGRILHQQADYDNALAALTQALEIYRRADDLPGIAAVGAELGLLHTRMGTNRDGAELLATIVKDQRVEPMLRADLLRALAANLREIGETDKAARCGEEALALARRLSSSARQGRTLLRVARTLGVIYLLQGNLGASIAVLSEAIAGGRWAHENDIELSWSWCVLGTTHYSAGDFDAALAAFRTAESLTGRHVATQQKWIGLWRGCLYRDLGRFDDAETELGEVGDKALADVALLRLRQKESDEALRLARMAHRARRRLDTAPERARADGTLAIVCASRGLYEAADRHFDEADSALRTSGSMLRLASLRLHRAGADLDRGRLVAANRLIAQTLAEARQRGYRHFLWWDPFLVGKICAQALILRCEIPYVRDLILSRLGRDEAVHFRMLQNDRNELVRNDATAILQGLTRGNAVDPGSLEELLRDCDNPRTRAWLGEAVAQGTVSAVGIERLRRRFGLTWKELEVFVMYYLCPAVHGHKVGTNLRRMCADRLHVSENTVRAHIKSIRLKTDLAGEAGTVAVKEWLLAAGIAA